MEIFDVVVEIESTGISTRYAEFCPTTIPRASYCERLVRLLLFSPDSLRMITVPGTSLTIDKKDIKGILVATST